MKYIHTFFFLILCFLFLPSVVGASTSIGVIDSDNDGSFVAEMENSGLGSATTINFGKFTTQSARNITVTSTEIRGFAWGEGVGWIVTNCADTTSGCSSTNGNFKISNDGNGLLSGYAWGENTGWINFGPFTNSGISQVKIDTGVFGGTIGSAGYAWAQNFGWIKFDCSSPSSCVKTDWRPTTTVYQCNDGIDNDSNGDIDYPADSGCTSATDDTERSSGGGGGGGDVCVSNPSLCVPPPDTCATNPSLCVPPPDACATNPSLCVPPPDTCATNPGLCIAPPDRCEVDPSACISSDDTCATNPSLCVPPPDTCATNPSLCVPPPDTCMRNPDLCVPPPTFCSQYPEKCIPTKDLLTKVSSVLVNVKDITAGTGATVVKISGVVVVAAVSTVASLAGSAVSFYDISLLLARLWSLLLVAFGIKKKNNPWGTVYNAVTKQPIDPAYVVLYDSAGNEIATSITDMDGRYGFSVPAGIYTIMVNKSNHTFPSMTLAGKGEDELYKDLYFGGPITVSEDGGIIAKNIPMDQIGFDWNEYVKNEQHQLHRYHRRDLWIARLSNSIFIIGFIITGVSFVLSPTILNGILTFIYVGMAIIKITGFKIHPKGSVVDRRTESPLPFSIIRLFSKETNREMAHKVADSRGTYYALVPNGQYTIVVDRKNPDQSYTPIPVSQSVDVTKGYLKQHFKL